MQSLHRLTVGFVAAICLIIPSAAHADESGETHRAWLEQSRRVVFLGDSITAAGHYIVDFDAWLVSLRLAREPMVIDAGLASETVSGLSEAGHANGAFPRPDLFERLDRVLATTKPDLVIACYGINCGIYQPLDTERFARYRAGQQRLAERVSGAGARFIVMTPPTYDDHRKHGDFSYNAVLDCYGDWLLERRALGWNVIDLHNAMNEKLAAHRKSDPDFTFQKDAVHPDEAGHWLMAQALIGYFGDGPAAGAADPSSMLAERGAPKAILPLVARRIAVLRDAYVGAAGHKRPGVAKGLPIAEAERQATEISAEIQRLMQGDAPGKSSPSK